MLTGNEIYSRLGRDIIITPFNEAQLNPNSYNVKLHNELIIYENKILDLKSDNPTITVTIPEEGLILYPDVLYLGRTVEYTETYNLIPCIDGRSSIARLGIGVHVCAGFGDIGFRGTFTFEISVVQPVKIYPFIEIGQIYYYEPDGAIDQVYRGRYQGQVDATPSRFYQG